MIGVYVKIPIACFRMGHAREYWETHPLPPPSTCYGFLLSLVGEDGEGHQSSEQRQDPRLRHIGARVTAMLLGAPDLSVVFRTLWRIKEDNYWVDPTGRAHIVPKTKKQRQQFENWGRAQGWPKPEYAYGAGCGSNKTPGHQQLLTNVELIIWLDSTDEVNGDPTLEYRVANGLDPARRGDIRRFGGLSLGESTHLVDSVSLLTEAVRTRIRHESGQVYLETNETDARHRRLTLPVWVDHVGSAGTNYTSGTLEQRPLIPPDVSRIPRIAPKE